MNEKINWNHNAEGDAVEFTVDLVCRDEVLQALNKMKTGKAPEDESLEFIAANGKYEFKRLLIYIRVLGGMGLPVGSMHSGYNLQKER